MAQASNQFDTIDVAVERNAGDDDIGTRRGVHRIRSIGHRNRRQPIVSQKLRIHFACIVVPLDKQNDTSRIGSWLHGLAAMLSDHHAPIETAAVLRPLARTRSQ